MKKKKNEQVHVYILSDKINIIIYNLYNNNIKTTINFHWNSESLILKTTITDWLCFLYFDEKAYYRWYHRRLVTSHKLYTYIQNVWKNAYFIFCDNTLFLMIWNVKHYGLYLIECWYGYLLSKSPVKVYSTVLVDV